MIKSHVKIILFLSLLFKLSVCAGNPYLKEFTHMGTEIASNLPFFEQGKKIIQKVGSGATKEIISKVFNLVGEYTYSIINHPSLADKKAILAGTLGTVGILLTLKGLKNIYDRVMEVQEHLTYAGVARKVSRFVGSSAIGLSSLIFGSAILSAATQGLGEYLGVIRK